ncbi:Hypothetical protein J6899_00963 [Nakaseomyces glabratus]
MFSFFLHFLLYFAWVRSSNSDLFHLAKRDITPNIESHPQGCSPVDTSGIKPGLKMDLYRFPITPPGTGCWSWDWLTVTPDFPRSGYWKWPKIAEVDGVVGPLHLDSGHPTCDPLTSVLPHGFNYLQSITTTNFTMVLHGYFVPKQSGKYTFEFKADDALLLNLGAGNAFSCCDYNNSQYNQGEYLAYAIWSKNNQTATLYLEKGIYYPIRVFYHNRCCGAYMDVVYYFNDSPIPNRDFSGLLFSIPDSDSCDANIGFDETCSSINTITTYSTQYITTSPPSGNTPITSTIYYIATPCNNTPEKPRCPTGFYDPFNNVCYIPDYTTTFTSDGHTITEVVSHITTTDSNRKTVTYTTTMMSYAENGPGLYTSFGPAPPVETHTVVLENNMTNYEVVSYWTTTNEFGGLITTSSTSTYSAPPLTVTATTASDYIESDWISFFITTNDKGDIITDSTLFNATRDYNLPEAPHTSFGPAPPVETHTVVLENNMTNYEVVSYWTTTNEFGGLITTSSTSTYSAPPLTVTATTASDYIESDWISFFITTNDKGDIITDSTLFNATRDYNLPEAPHTSFGPAPPVETHTVVLENNMTNYEVVSYWTTTNEFGGLITTSSTSTYSAPPLTVTATTASDYIESDWISFFITTNDKGDIITDSTLFNATRDYNLPEAPHTSFGPAPPVETHTVVLENNMTNYEVVSYWTTTNEFGGLITTSSTSTYSAPPLTVTATTASDYIESDWISFFITTNDKGDIITDSTLFNATRDYNLPEAPHTSFGPAPPVETHTVVLENNMTNYEVVSYWTTTNEFGGLITTSSTSTYSAPPLTVTATTASDYIESDWISFFITTNDKGDIITDSTLFNATRDYNLPEAPHTSFGPAPPVETHTVVLENNMTNYEVVSYWTTTNEFGGLITTSSTSTYSAPPLTVTATTASDYIESDWISFFITTNDKGDIITDSTLFNATRDYNLPEAPHTSFGPAPPVETHTVVLENNMTNYEVVSYWTTTNEFGGLITTSSTSTYSAPPLTVTATTASDYIESDWISFFITTNDKGDIITDSTLFNATRDYNLPEAPHTSFGPAPPVETHTVVLENNMTNYEVVSYWTTTNEFGGLITTSSTSTYSAPPLTVTATTASDYIESDWISFFITTNDKGDIITDSTLFNATRDYIDAQAPFTSSSSYLKSEVEESDYTTTIDNGNGDFETDLVSHITTKDSDGKPTTITTTIPLKPSDAGEADYTTTITSDGHTITEVVSHITTTDSDGNTVTYTTTMASFDQVGDGVYTSAPPYSQPPVVTTTVTEDDGSSKTVVISYSPSEGEDGVTRTGTTTISTITASGEADYTTTIDKGNGDFETDLVSHITTKDSDGKPTTIITTVTLTEEPDYTSVFVSDGHTITAVVSHVTTTNDIGQTVTTTVTVMSYDQVGEGVFTSAPAYSQPPVTTTTVSANTATATVVISYFPSIGDDGVTRTGTTTISTVPVGGEVDYTTTVDRGNGSTETDVISHITTTDSNGNPTTITTTITNAPAPSNSKANVGSDYTTTVVSNGHTIVSTVTQTVGGQSHGNTVSSAAPVTTVSGASFNAPGTAVVGGIVNSQKSQSQYVAGQGSGNEKPTQAAGTAGGSGSGSVHQSAGNIVPSGSPSVQSAKGTASPVSGIHSSQTPHSVPSQAQQQGQGQAQAPSSLQQAATTVLLPSGSSVNNIGSGFNSTQTASVLQGKGASIKVTSISILFSIITVIVVGMI